MVVEGVVLLFVRNEDGGGPTRELDQMEYMNGERADRGRTRDIQKMKNGSNVFVPMNAGEQSKLVGGGIQVHDVPVLKPCIFR